MFMKSTIEKEMQDCECLINKIGDLNNKEHIKNSLRWFVEKAVKNKGYYYLLSIISFLAPAIVSVVMVFSTEKTMIQIVLAIVSGSAAFSSYLLQLMDVRRKWRLYRNQAEIIKSSLSLYRTPGHTDESELVKTIEASMNQTHGRWLRYFRDKSF